MGQTKDFVYEVVRLTVEEERQPLPQLLDTLSTKIAGAPGRLMHDEHLAVGRHPRREDCWIVAGHIRRDDNVQ